VGIEWIIFSSADGSDQLNSAEAAAFQAALDNGADLVVGERVSSPESRRNLQPVQLFGNDLACAWLALGWGRRFLDLGSLRVIHQSAFERLRLRYRGFGWNIEMQARAIEEGLRIAEVPVQHHPRQGGQPKISGHPLGVVKAGWAILWTIARLYATKRSRKSAKPLQVLCREPAFATRKSRARKPR
jgi:hypothetical protein